MKFKTGTQQEFLFKCLAVMHDVDKDVAILDADETDDGRK